MEMRLVGGAGSFSGGMCGGGGAGLIGTIWPNRHYVADCRALGLLAVAMRSIKNKISL